MMTYKFLNTFIDDIFAFVIKMPTMYRLGVFRDGKYIRLKSSLNHDLIPYFMFFRYRLLHLPLSEMDLQSRHETCQ